MARILLIRGRAYYGTGDYWKALNDLSQVIETQPTPMAFYYRGITYQANGMEERQQFPF